ncbi:MAG: hypothetical protein EA376_00690 [Phycisphaeraceae bacterium]|nr:MAG: hypothetical protein EA376_00690 [Phycisphaeraceae bacterium]
MTTAGDPFRKVRSGERLVIPAPTWNGFIDAARFVRGAAAPTPEAMSRGGRARWDSLAKNGASSNAPRFGVLGIERKMTLLPDGLDRFITSSRDVLGRPPTADDYGRFVISVDPIRDGDVGRTLSSGVTLVRLKDWDEDKPQFADIDVGEVGHLKFNPGGAAEILWVAAVEIEAGLRWCMVRIGARPVSPGVIRAFELGDPNVIEAGDDTTQAEIEYATVTLVGGGVVAEDVDPGAAPHHWRRQNLGEYEPGDMATGYFTPEGEVRIVTVNEYPLQGACDS